MTWLWLAWHMLESLLSKLHEVVFQKHPSLLFAKGLLSKKSVTVLNLNEKCLRFQRRQHNVMLSIKAKVTLAMINWLVIKLSALLIALQTHIKQVSEVKAWALYAVLKSVVKSEIKMCLRLMKSSPDNSCVLMHPCTAQEYSHYGNASSEQPFHSHKSITNL